MISCQFQCLVAILLLAGGSLARAQQPVAYIQFGGTGYWTPEADWRKKPNRAAPGMNRVAHAYKSLPQVAKAFGPKLKANGFTRVHCQNIGGHWPLHYYNDAQRSHIANRDEITARGLNAKVMWINQWLLAEQAGVPWANREELNKFHSLLVSDYSIREVIYYLGGPYDVSFELQKLSLEPFIRLRGASFGFDYVVTREHFEQSADLFKWIKAQNPRARIYTEGRPQLSVPLEFSKLTDGTIAQHQNDLTWGQSEYERARRYWGEVLSLEGAGPGDTPLLKTWQE